jgi:hypothetical protein
MCVVADLRDGYEMWYALGKLANYAGVLNTTFCSVFKIKSVQQDEDFMFIK